MPPPRAALGAGGRAAPKSGEAIHWPDKRRQSRAAVGFGGRFFREMPFLKKSEIYVWAETFIDRDSR